MRKIPAEFLQKLKDKVNLIDVVGEHVVLRKSGSNHTGLCPFHSERSPSFSVSEVKQLYHCYGCKRGGDLLRFVMDIHGIGFPEAVEEIAERGRIALPKDWSGAPDPKENPEEFKRREAQREKLALAHKLNRFAAAFFHQSLPKSPHIEAYFNSRGSNSDLARLFYIGGAPASWDALSRHLTEKKAPLELATELGLIRPSQKKAGEHFDLFRNRAMFPILDMRGKVAGFGGRILPIPEGYPDVGADGPKYLNSPESILFQKSKLVFGLYQAQKHVREKDEVILVEGYFDVMALHAHGFGHSVATCGTSLTPDHLGLFKRFSSKVTILFDGDRAGVSATERAMEVGLDQGLVLYGAAMPEGLDPDELLEQPGGPERMKEILAQAKPILDSRIEAWIRKAAEGPEARTQALKKIATWLARFRDPVGREIRVQTVQAQLGVTRGLIDQAMGLTPGAARTGSQGPPRISAQPKAKAAPSRKKELLSPGDLVLLAAFAWGDKFTPLFVEAGRNLPPEMTISDLFDSSLARDFVAHLLREAGALERFRAVPEVVLGGELDAQVRSIVTEALISDHPPYEADEVRRALGRGQARTWARFSQRIRTALSEAEANKDAGLQAKWMKEYLDVQRKLKEFNSFYDEA